MIPIKYLNFNKEAPDKGYWDMFLFEKIFSQDKENFYVLEKLKKDEEYMTSAEIIIIPARQNVKFINEINEYLSELESAVIILCGDEDAEFPVEMLKHPNIKIWLMLPHPDKEYRNVDRFLGSGITPHTDFLPIEAPQKTQDWFFSGQVTHKRRVDCVRNLRKLKNGKLTETEGFTLGLEPKEYIEELAKTKVIPCPSGAIIQDSFRLFEALEAGCIPLADALNSRNDISGYWQLIFGENIPFPIVQNWDDLEGLIQHFKDRPDIALQCFSFWIKYKRDIKQALIDDFLTVTNKKRQKDEITIIIPTSPIQSHPDTSIIEQTISTIRTHLPNSEIIITFDGIRDEQFYLRPEYQEYIYRLLWKINKEYTNVIPILFNTHQHQTGMLKEALKHVKTEKILYVEHDTPLTPDCEIDWNECNIMLNTNKADLIRFHFESHIPEDHKKLVFDPIYKVNKNLGFLKTIQWSQRPHLTTKAFYERILNDYFSVDAKSFIEDKIHGVVLQAYKNEQMQGWNKFKLWIYHPTDGNIKRSYDLNGRGKEQKYSMTF